MRASATESKLDAEIKAEQVGAILILASKVNIEFARRDFSGQGNGLFELVVSGRDGALKIGVIGSCLFADIESAC